MCGRYVTPEVNEIENVFHVGRHNWLPRIKPLFNAAPTMQVPIVLMDAGERVAALARWGLIPSWWQKPTLPNLTFNARSEEAANKPTWRDSLRRSRCFLPARGWYEWNESEPARTSSGRSSNQPYYFYAPDQAVLAIAGLCAWWQAPDGAQILSCALLSKECTTPGLAEVHHRMPVILDESEFDAWLSPRTAASAVSALIASSRNDFLAHRVSTQVNNTRNDSPELIAALPERVD